MTTKEKRILPADVYDALEFSALAFGGVGGQAWFTDGSVTGNTPDACPICIAGHAYAIEPAAILDNAIRRLVPSLGQNDAAVQRINRRKGAKSNARVSWKEYTREIPIVRGE